MRMRRISVLILLLGAATSQCLAASADEIRQPAVAGSFYPQDPKELAAAVDGMIARAAVPATQDHIVALIAPHAGYAYSGAVAAHSYALLKGQKIHRVVVIAPSHFEEFPFSAVYDGNAYATPLGKVPVDKVLARKLASMSPLIKLSSRGHAPSQGQAEHSLEVQLPFLQRTLPDFELVPIVMGEQSYEASRALGVALAELIQGSDTLIVASSDLSHYHTYDEASTLDHKTLNAISEWDYLTLSRNFQIRIWEACGGGPIVAAMIAAEASAGLECHANIQRARRRRRNTCRALRRNEPVVLTSTRPAPIRRRCHGRVENNHAIRAVAHRSPDGRRDPWLFLE